MGKVLNVTLDSIINREDPEKKYLMEHELLIIETDGSHIYKLNPSFYPLRFEAYSIILVQQGEMTIGINYMTYVMKKNDVMELFHYHLIESLNFSSDYKAYQIIISPDLFNRIIEYANLTNILSYYSPRYSFVKTMEDGEIEILLTQIERLKKTMARDRLPLLKIMVRAELVLLLTELANIKMLNQSVSEYSCKHTRCEEIASQFIRLLVNYCRTEPEVSFYSDKLCITPEYLSRTMKSFSGKSVNIWIQLARVAEAKVLLRKPYSTIRQVADELCFSDQSAFGKFFKKHTGRSPLEYQKDSDMTISTPMILNIPKIDHAVVNG